MLARPSDPYNYYLSKVLFATYMDDVCLLELAFLRVRGSNFSKMSLVGLDPSIIKARSKSRQK